MEIDIISFTKQVLKHNSFLSKIFFRSSDCFVNFTTNLLTDTNTSSHGNGCNNGAKPWNHSGQNSTSSPRNRSEH
jgi:hypothetical protein